MPDLPVNNSQDSMESSSEKPAQLVLPARPQPQQQPQQQPQLQQNEDDQEQQGKPLRERAGSGVSNTGRRSQRQPLANRSNSQSSAPKGGERMNRSNSQISAPKYGERMRQRRQKSGLSSGPDIGRAGSQRSSSARPVRAAQVPHRSHIVEDASSTVEQLQQPVDMKTPMQQATSEQAPQVVLPQPEQQPEVPTPSASETIVAKCPPQDPVMADFIKAGGKSMSEELQAEWLICNLYARKSPSKLREVQSILEKYAASRKVRFYKVVCEKYGETPMEFASERRERRAAELVRDLYMRMNPMAVQQVEKLLEQCTGSREKFYRRVCAKYGEKPVDLAAEQEAHDAMFGAMSNGSTRAPSSSSESRGKQCSMCHSVFSGFGSVCSGCRKRGSQGSAQQCSICSEYFQGFGDTCPDCKVNAELFFKA